MFLIRTAFWLSVVVFLIPVDDSLKREAAATQRPIDAFEAVQVAQSTYSDAAGFCERNPDTCEIGSRIATTFMLKARSGALMVAEMLDTELAERGAVPPATVPGAVPAGTLTADDRQPGWQGPATDPAGSI